MKLYQYLITILLSVHLSAIAQDNELSGILSAKDDTSKAKELSAYINKNRQSSPEKSAQLTRQLLDLSKKLQFNKGIADALSYSGYFEFNKGEVRSAIQYTTDAIGYYQRCRDTLSISKCYGNLAIEYEAINVNDSAMLYRMTAIHLIENNPTPLLAKHYINLAVQFNNRLDNADKALYYYKKAEEIALKTNDSTTLVSTWTGISHVLNGEEKYKESLVYARKSIEMAKGVNNYVILSQSYENYSNILMELGQLNAAVSAAKSGIQYAEIAGYEEGIVINGIRLSKVLKRKGDYKEQKNVLQKTLEKAKKASIQYYSYIYTELAAANYSLGSYKTAYDYRSLANTYADSNRTERDSKIFAELETKYQSSLKEKALAQKQLQLAQKDLQVQKSRGYMYYSFGGMAVALFLAVILYLRSRHKKQVHNQELIALRQQKELHLLQAIMQGEEKERSRIAKDLHDGVAGMLAAVKMHFSSMPEVNQLVQTEGYQQGMMLLNDASQQIRITSHNLMPEVLLQLGLDEALRRYCNSINNSRMLQMEYDSWGDIGRFADNFGLSVYRIVQELLGNIVKHSKATTAMVQLSQQNHVLSISIEDNGIGFATAHNGDGMGLNNLKSRISAMNGKIEIESSRERGVSVWLEFDILE